MVRTSSSRYGGKLASEPRAHVATVRDPNACQVGGPLRLSDQLGIRGGPAGAPPSTASVLSARSVRGTRSPGSVSGGALPTTSRAGTVRSASQGDSSPSTPRRDPPAGRVGVRSPVLAGAAPLARKASVTGGFTPSGASRPTIGRSKSPSGSASAGHPQAAGPIGLSTSGGSRPSLAGGFKSPGRNPSAGHSQAVGAVGRSKSPGRSAGPEQSQASGAALSPSGTRPSLARSKSPGTTTPGSQAPGARTAAVVRPPSPGLPRHESFPGTSHLAASTRPATTPKLVSATAPSSPPTRIRNVAPALETVHTPIPPLKTRPCATDWSPGRTKTQTAASPDSVGSVGEDGSECSTRASGAATSSFGCLSATSTQASVEKAENAVIFFDWDDTLFPAGHIQEHFPPSSVREGVRPGAALRMHGRIVEETLRAARAAGRVCIVTLSARPWVTQSAEKYLPGFDLPALLEEFQIPVFYAAEHAGVPGCRASEVRCTQASDLTTLKANAMARCLNEWYCGDILDRAAGLNVISVGDSMIEAEALREVMEEWSRSPLFPDDRFCKTVKLMECPTLHQLSSELLWLPEWLERLALLRRDFDLCITGPEDFESQARAAIAT